MNLKIQLCLILGLLLTAQTTAYCQETASQSPWNWSRILDNTRLIDELEIVPEQVPKLRNAIAQTENESRRLRSELKVKRYGDKANRVLTKAEIEELTADRQAEARWAEEFRKLHNQQQNVLKARVSKILLPHQIERLEQLALWSEINSSGFANAMVSEPARTLLEIDKAQVKKIEAKAAEYQQDFAKQLFKLRQKYRDKLEQSLDDQQREKIAEIFGDDSSILSPNIRF